MCQLTILRKYQYIFLFILIGIILGGNLIYAQNSDLSELSPTAHKSREHASEMPNFAKNALFQAQLIPFIGLNSEETVNPEKTLQEILIPEKELAIRQEAVCEFLESERPEKYLRAEICK